MSMQYSIQILLKIIAPREWSLLTLTSFHMRKMKHLYMECINIRIQRLCYAWRKNEQRDWRAEDQFRDIKFRNFYSTAYLCLYSPWSWASENLVKDMTHRSLTPENIPHACHYTYPHRRPALADRYEMDGLHQMRPLATRWAPLLGALQPQWRVSESSRHTL